MGNTDVAKVREIEAAIRQGLALIASEAHRRILMLENIDRDKAWQEVKSALDANREDLIDDSMHWLRQQTRGESPQSWSAAVDAQIQYAESHRAAAIPKLATSEFSH